jgi:hypothetical protein
MHVVAIHERHGDRSLVHPEFIASCFHVTRDPDGRSKTIATPLQWRFSTVALIQATEPDTNSPGGGLLAILLLAMVIAYPLSFGILRRYRRTLLRSMHTGTDRQLERLVSSEVSASPDQPTQTGPEFVVLDPDSTIATGGPAEALYSKVLYAPWRAAAIYAAAGVGYALAMASAALMSFMVEFSPLRFLLFFLIYAWSIVLTINVVAAATRRARLAVASVYFLIFAVLGAVVLATSPALGWTQIAVLWLLATFPTTLLVLTFLSLRIRAVGPLVLIITVVALVASNLALAVASGNETLLRSVTTLGVALGLDAASIFVGVLILNLAVFVPIGWVVLRWIGGRYERKKVSDQSLAVDAIWLLSGVLGCIVLIPGGFVFLFAGLLAFVVYKAVSQIGFWLLVRQGTRASESPKLLLLRVFSLGRRSERFFDALATHWRHVGSIQFIAGPDLATATVEPQELVEFLRGRLMRRFIDGPETLDLRISKMDLEPDPDGRFRVSKFFCYDHTWQIALSRLAGYSDVVLMDLRGFSSQNLGMIIEIDEVINLVPLGRVVVVIDDTTDEQYLRQTVQQSWKQMRPTSPNRLSAVGQLRLFRLKGSRGGDLRRLLRTVCGAVPATAESRT